MSGFVYDPERDPLAPVGGLSRLNRNRGKAATTGEIQARTAYLRAGSGRTRRPPLKERPVVYEPPPEQDLQTAFGWDVWNPPQLPGGAPDVMTGMVPLIGPAGAPGMVGAVGPYLGGGVTGAAGWLSKIGGMLGLGAGGAAILEGITPGDIVPGMPNWGNVGGGGGGLSLQGNINLPISAAFSGGIPSGWVAYSWDTGTARFYRLIDGRIAVQKKNGVWKVYRAKKHIVVSSNPRIGTFNRAAKRFDKLEKRLTKKVYVRRK